MTTLPTMAAPGPPVLVAPAPVAHPTTMSEWVWPWQAFPAESGRLSRMGPARCFHRAAIGNRNLAGGGANGFLPTFMVLSA